MYFYGSIGVCPRFMASVGWPFGDNSSNFRMFTTPENRSNIFVPAKPMDLSQIHSHSVDVPNSHWFDDEMEVTPIFWNQF